LIGILAVVLAFIRRTRYRVRHSRYESEKT